MPDKIDVKSGDPYRAAGGKFGTSPVQKLEDSFKALEGKKFVGHDYNKSKIDSLKGDAKDKLAELRSGNTSNNKDALITSPENVHDHIKKIRSMGADGKPLTDDEKKYLTDVQAEADKASKDTAFSEKKNQLRVLKGEAQNTLKDDVENNAKAAKDSALSDYLDKSVTDAGISSKDLAQMKDDKLLSFRGDLDSPSDKEWIDRRVDLAVKKYKQYQTQEKAGLLWRDAKTDLFNTPTDEWSNWKYPKDQDISRAGPLEEAGKRGIFFYAGNTDDVTNNYEDTWAEKLGVDVKAKDYTLKSGGKILQAHGRAQLAHALDPEGATKIDRSRPTRGEVTNMTQYKTEQLIAKNLRANGYDGVAYDGYQTETDEAGEVVIYNKALIQSKKDESAAQQVFGKENGEELFIGFNAFTEDQQRQVDLATEQFKQSVQRVDNQILAQYIQAIQAGDYAQADKILDNTENSQQTHTLIFALLTISAILLPIYALQRINALFSQFGLHTTYVYTKTGQNAIKEQAEKGAASHVHTIAKDLKKQLDAAIDGELNNADVKANMEAKFPKLKDSKNYLADVKDNKTMYKYAQDLILNGASRDEIIKKLQENFPEIAKKRANVIAGNESNRVFTLSQFEADDQFLAQNKLTDKAYKRLVSNTGHPEAICKAIIGATAVHPIPFKQDFIPFGKEFVVKVDGKTHKFTPNYEHLKSGHIHVNCHCRYELMIKRDDGTWLNSNTNKIENIPDFKPDLHPRDKKGKFAKKGTTVGKNILDVSKLGTKKDFDDFVEKSDMNYTKQQQFTADSYQSPHGYAINEAYRLNSKTIKMNDDKLSAAKFAETFDSTFDMTIPEESTLFRGVGDSPSDFIVGKNYVDRGYMSSSTVEKTARGKFTGPGGSLIYLKVPAGQKVAVPDVISGKTSLDEQEVLLARGTSYSVYKIDGDIVYAVII